MPARRDDVFSLRKVLLGVVVAASIPVALSVYRSRWSPQACTRRVKDAEVATRVIRNAANLWQLTENDFEHCPAFEDLIRARQIDHTEANIDPWGSPYRIICRGADVKVVSAGPDETFQTRDDISTQVRSLPQK